MSIALEIPDKFILNSSENEILHRMKLDIALMEYKNERFSIGQACEFAGISIYDFLDECQKEKIETIRYGPDELDKELDILKDV